MIYSCLFTKTDPNYDAPGENKYQEALKDYISKNNVKLLLDLHGAAKKREYAVEMGTALEYEEDFSLHQFKFATEIIKSIFEEKFYPFKIEQKKVWKNNTVTKFISENTDTPCIQLEINGNYRNPENKEEFVGLVEVLIKIINYFSKHDWGSI